MTERVAVVWCPHLGTAEQEPVVAAIEAVAPRIEIMNAGRFAVPTIGPSRYFGGEEVLVQHMAMLVEETEHQCRIGIADGVFTAALAAKAYMVVPPGESAMFLAPQPISVLERPELVDLLKRLGIRTLGDFAALPGSDVLNRFGNDGLVAHRTAQGFDPEPFQARVTPVELSAVMEFEEPVQRVDTAAFAARAVAEQVHSQMSRQGLACSRIVIEAETEHGENLTRVWRHDGQLTQGAIVERVRWQLDGWLTTSGITLLRLVPEGLMADNGRQMGFWGGSIDADERTARALARVQGMLGEEAVVTAVLGGGRSLSEQMAFIPWGVEREKRHDGLPNGVDHLRPPPPRVHGSSPTKPVRGRKPRLPEVPPWPGKLPAPAPATVYEEWQTAQLLDEHADQVKVDGRGAVSASPAAISIDGRAPTPISAWAGPWLTDERWWDPTKHRRRARMQVLTENGDALLTTLEKGSWYVEARYD